MVRPPRSGWRPAIGRAWSARRVPFESRLIAVVEALEAMTAARYDRPRTGSALDELDPTRGTQFDPDITDACWT